MSAPATTPQDLLMIKSLIAKIHELAVLPHVVFKVLEVTGSSESPAVEIERAILVDPGFSTRLLSVSNSAYYALPRKVNSIREAVMFLGFKAIRQLAMTVGVFDLFIGKGDKESLRRRAWWRHSLDTAVCARVVAMHSKRLSPDEAYTCGLLHYLGKSLLDRFMDGNYDDVEALMEAGMGEIEAERRVFGLVHPEASLAAALKWGFPPALTSSLNYISPPNPGDEAAEHRACVGLSSWIAKHAVGAAVLDSAPLWTLQILGLSADDLPQITQHGTEAIAHSAGMPM